MKKLLIMASLFWPQKKSGGPPISIMNLVQSVKDKFDIYIISKNHEINDDKPLEGIFPGWNKFEFGKAFYTSKDEHTFKIITGLIENVEPDVIYQNSFFSIDDLLPVLAYKKKRCSQRRVLSKKTSSWKTEENSVWQIISIFRSIERYIFSGNRTRGMYAGKSISRNTG